MARTRERSCTHKRRETKAEAWEHYWALKRRGATMIHVYNCKFCEFYHVGHKPKPRKNRKR